MNTPTVCMPRVMQQVGKLIIGDVIHVSVPAKSKKNKNQEAQIHLNE